MPTRPPPPAPPCGPHSQWAAVVMAVPGMSVWGALPGALRSRTPTSPAGERPRGSRGPSRPQPRSCRVTPCVRHHALLHDVPRGDHFEVCAFGGSPPPLRTTARRVPRVRTSGGTYLHTHSAFVARTRRLESHFPASSHPPPQGMHWNGAEVHPPPPPRGAQPTPSHCLPYGRCRLPWHLQPPPTALATSANRLSNRFCGRL